MNLYSILSKYGVHGFPTLFLLNSTMRVRYHGSRTLGSFIAFYGDVTGRTSPGKLLLKGDQFIVDLVDKDSEFSSQRSHLIYTLGNYVNYANCFQMNNFY